MLKIDNLSIRFDAYSQPFQRTSTCAIRCLDLGANAGEVVAVVGQSGAGKSLLAHVLLGILPNNACWSGSIVLHGETLTNERIRQLRGRSVAFIPQSVMSLNPLLRVGKQLTRSGILNGLSRKRARKSARLALARYGLAPEVYCSFPFQLSGGMARRVLTANATTFAADLLLADEPTNGLDDANIRETLTHLRQLADSGKAVILITHDIEAALSIADRISVFCNGVTIEEAAAADFNGGGKLRHRYSEALWSALPGNSFTDDLTPLRMNGTTQGCPFLHCCPTHDRRCRLSLPEFMEKDGGRVRCWHA